MKLKVALFVLCLLAGAFIWWKMKDCSPGGYLDHQPTFFWVTLECQI